MDKKPEKLVPEVRFKGFTDDWEQRKFDNVVKRINDKDDNPELPHIEFENIISGNGTLNKNIKDLNSKKIGTKFQKEDILFGKLRPYLKNWYFAKENGIAVGDFWVLRAKKISVFVYYLIQTEKFYSIANLSSGSKMPRSDWNLVSNSRFNFPENTIESIKIGNLILQLDKLITLQQRKLEQLKQLKKAMLQQLFVNKNNKQPNLRFKNFNGDWEERKLSDIANYRNGKAHEQYIDMNGIYTVVNSKFISTNGKVKKFSNEPIELLKKGEIAFVLSDVPNGKALAKAYLIDSDNKYSLNQRIAGISPSSDINSYFLYVLMNRNRYFLKFDDGVGQTNLSKKDIEEFKENYPLFDEQQKIANLFSQIQTLISLQQNKHTQLIALKKYLLQKLFI
ncbi:restriction endonuclease subunit S [Limosilactobacillus reuteri]|nr:restriction endonuclease subunit S [Limosilactobacillus reuteri]